MNIPDICPACSTVLPADYPFDHVAIDRALGGDRNIFAAMTSEERLETVLVGLSRGKTLFAMAQAWNWSHAWVQRLLPADHPLSAARQRRELEEKVRALWGEGLSDIAISAHLGQLDGGQGVQVVRRRLGLPAHFGPGGRRRKAVVA